MLKGRTSPDVRQAGEVFRKNEPCLRGRRESLRMQKRRAFELRRIEHM